MNRVIHLLRRDQKSSPAGASPNDQELLQKYLHQRDQGAFAELVRRHELSVLKACRTVLRSPVDVDDAFQATFLVLLRRAREVRWQPSIRGWLVAVAHRIAVRLAMTQARADDTRLVQEPAGEALDPADKVSWKEACAALHDELNQLRDAYRLPLLLCYLQGLTRDEAAEQLGWSLGSVKAGLERGRAELKARLERRGITLSAGLLTLLARPVATDAATTSASMLAQSLMGTPPSRLISLCQLAGVWGSVWTSRVALVAVALVLLGAVAGLAWAWPKPDAQVRNTAPAPVTARVHPTSPAHPDEATISGQVVDVDGKPVAGAAIILVGPNRTQIGFAGWSKPETVASTNAQGQFQFITKQDQFHVAAAKTGLGLDFVWVAPEKRTQPVKLQMRQEELVQGTVVDEKGQPLQGVKFSVTSVRQFTVNDLEDGLEQARKTFDWSAPFRKSGDYLTFNNVAFDVPSLTAISNAQGQFVLQGLPVGAVVGLMSSSPGMVWTTRNVVLLPGFADTGTARHKLTAEALETATLKESGQQAGETLEQTKERFRRGGYTARTFEAPSMTITMRKGVTVEGKVTNLKGEPVAGIGVMMSGGNYQSGLTDPQGRYRFDGVTPHESYMAQTGSHEKYLVAQSSAVHRDAGPIRINLQVRPGAVLKGQVIDGKTGKGVASLVTVSPTPGNVLNNKADVQKNYTVNTDLNGNFRMVAPPGDVFISADASKEESVWPVMPYKSARILPSHDGLLQRSTHEVDQVHFQGQTTYFKLGHAYQLMELPLEGESTVELTMQRGNERTLNIVDPQGKPVDSAMIAGLDATARPLYVKAGPHQIVGLTDAARTRDLCIMNRERKLGALVRIPTNIVDPLTVKLEPLASFSARLVDRDKNPRADLQIGIRPRLNTDREQFIQNPTSRELDSRILSAFFPTPITTGTDGRLMMNDIIPNLDLVFYPMQRGQNPWNSRFFMTTYQLKQGEARSEGDVVVLESRARPGVNR